jgi:Astacin (Peptidase family M12A)
MLKNIILVLCTCTFVIFFLPTFSSSISPSLFNKGVTQSSSIDFESISDFYSKICSHHRETKNFTVFEDDMIIRVDEVCLKDGASSKTDNELEMAAVRNEKWLWPNATIHYTIEDVPEKSRIVNAIEQWDKNTILKFIPINVDSKSDSVKDYVSFEWTPGNICKSEVGRIGGKQLVQVSDKCTAGNLMHEIGHTIGLWHEHLRTDSKKHVVFNMSNIDPQGISEYVVSNTFKIHDVGNYDYCSIMHYDPYEFALDETTHVIQTTSHNISNNECVGQRNNLSNGDIKGIDSIYSKKILSQILLE